MVETPVLDADCMTNFAGKELVACTKTRSLVVNPPAVEVMQSTYAVDDA